MSKEEVIKLLKSQSFHIMEPDEVDYFATVSGEAFPSDYPLSKYFYGKKNCQEKVIQGMIFNYRVMSDYCLCYSFEDRSIGNVLILPPGSPTVSLSKAIKKGGLKLMLKLGIGTLVRMMRYERYSEEVRKKYADDKTWYFENLAIAKEHQGNKLVASLAGPIIMYLDSIGANIYFETHSLSNVAIYEHYGFTVVEKGKIPGTDVDQFVLIKRPSPRTADTK